MPTLVQPANRSKTNWSTNADIFKRGVQKEGKYMSTGGHHQYKNDNTKSRKVERGHSGQWDYKTWPTETFSFTDENPWMEYATQMEPKMQHLWSFQHTEKKEALKKAHSHDKDNLERNRKIFNLISLSVKTVRAPWWRTWKLSVSSEASRHHSPFRSCTVCGMML